jgi:predicted Zn-dependent protease with MMP-like domain
MKAADRLRAARGVRHRFRTDRRIFERLVDEALASLPAPIVAHISNVAVVVEEWPGLNAADEVGDNASLPFDSDADDGPTELLGLYQGIPYGERQSGYGMVLPDRITIYRQPILAVCRTEDDAREEIRITVLHEIGHYFGLGDDELP